MADKKLFDADLRATPISTSQRIATGTPAGTTYNITVSDLSDWIIGNIPTPPTTTLLTKVVDIGGWDMQRNTGTACHDMGLGVTKSKVRAIDVTIYTNDCACLYPILHPRSDGETGSGWHMICSSATAVIRLFSRQDSNFNHSQFDGNAYGTNRGYVTVWYVE